MKESNKRIELLGSAPIPKALLSMGLPTIILWDKWYLICTTNS